MSQTDIYKLLTDQPQTQKQLVAISGMTTGQVSHELRCLERDRLIHVQQLEIAYRPKGYTKAGKAPARHTIKWPRY
jgi:predicted transcriptional regulator